MQRSRKRAFRWDWLTTACLLGCVGSIETATSVDDPGTMSSGRTPSMSGSSAKPGDPRTQPPGAEVPASTCGGGTIEIGPVFLRRLTNAEYRRTIADLLGGVADATSDFPADAVRGGFDNNAEAISISNSHIEKYRDAAERLTGEAVGDPARRARVFGCAVETEGQACLARFIQAFGRRAFRRPLGSDEISSLLALAESAAGRDDPYAGARLVLQAMLLSPNFLFKVEVGRPDPSRPGLLQLTGFEVATRLSYLLLGTTPDDTLLAAAEQGQLDTAAGVDAAAVRLLQDPRSRDAMQGFYGQWLQVSELDKVERDVVKYPLWNETLARAMRQETVRLMDDFLWKEGANVLDVLTAPYTYVNEPLSKLYGLSGIKDWTRVDLAPEDGRAGVLTQPGLLTATSVTEEGLPIHRGAFVRERLLCHHLPTPPDDIPPIPDAKPGQSDRDRLELHSKSAACAPCHALMDPIGFALSGFDMIGRRRTEDSAGQPLVTKGSLSGFETVDFDGAAGLADVLRRSPETSSCVATQLFRYAHGREEVDADACQLRQVAEAFQSSAFRFGDLLRALVRSEGFRYRPSYGIVGAGGI
jgi:hypothetical protein